MKRISTVFLIVGIVMFIFGNGYFWYAIQHPTFYIPIPLGLTYAIYLFYFLQTLLASFSLEFLDMMKIRRNNLQNKK